MPSAPPAARRRSRWWLLPAAALLGLLAWGPARVQLVGLAPSGTSLALLLEIPVVAVALRGRRRLAYATAVAAAVVLTLLLPPVGTFTIRVADDVVALLVFLVAALLVGRLVSGHVELLASVERQREAVLRSVSHDLRTPLSGIRAAATELSSGEPHDPATTGALLGVIERESERLDRLVANLLGLSRSRAGALHPRREPVDLEELLRLAAERLAPLRPDVDVVVSAPELPEVAADYGQLDQVVTNLLDNALRHSPPGATVRLAAAGAGARVRLTVEDEGPGVPPADRAAIFEPFRSGSRAGASGLGLAICEAIAVAHGGTVHVEDREEGGARFVVDLPAR